MNNVAAEIIVGLMNTTMEIHFFFTFIVVFQKISNTNSTRKFTWDRTWSCFFSDVMQ